MDSKSREVPTPSRFRRSRKRDGVGYICCFIFHGFYPWLL